MTNHVVVSLLLNDGAGGFGPKTDYATGVGPFGVAIGDLTTTANRIWRWRTIRM